MRVVEFDPYGIYLAAGGDEGVVYVYDMEGNETKLEAPPNGGAVYDIDWVQTYRENLILVGMVSGSVTIYDGFTYELIDSIDACDWVLSVEADADGKKFAGGCANGTVFVFTDGEVQKSTVHSDWVRSVSWSPEGNRFASASDDGKVIVWTVDENGAPHVDQVLRAGDVYVYSVAWSRDGTQLIATGESQYGTVRERDVMCHVPSPLGCSLVPFWGGISGVRDVSRWFHRQHCCGWSADDNGSLIYWSTGAVKEFEVDLQFARSLGDDYRRVMGVTTNYDGRRVVVGDTGGVVKLYEVDSGKVVTLGQHSDWVRAVAYDPLSMSVASVGDDGKLMVWDPRSGGLKKECEGAHNDWIRALAFSEEKKQLATAGDDMVVKIWRMPGYSCATTHEIQVPGGDYPIAVALSPDSSTVAVATIGGALYVMESASGEVVAEVQLANGYMDATGLAFSRDGLFLAAGGESLVVLDGETFEEITRVPAMGEIRDLAWNKDGNEASVALPGAGCADTVAVLCVGPAPVLLRV